MTTRAAPATGAGSSPGASPLRASLLTVGANILGQALRFGGNLVLTRLLLPEAFGLMLMANVVLMGLALTTDLGLRQVVIRTARAADPAFANPVWTLQLLQGLLIATLMLAAAGALAGIDALQLLPAGSILANPALPSVVAWLSVAAILAAPESTNMQLASRNLQASRVAAIELGSQVVALCVTLTCAREGAGIHALIAGSCVAAACRSLSTHVFLQGPRNRWSYDAATAREVLRFGAPILLTSCAGFLVGNADKLVLAWFLTAHEMGAYAVAMLFVNAFVEMFGKVMAQVALPAISSAATNDAAALRRTYLRWRVVCDAMCLAAAGLLATCGDWLIRLLYDTRYAEAGAFLALLGTSLFGIRYRLLSQVFLAIGRPRLMLYEQVSHLLAIVPAILLGFHFFGAAGAVAGVAASYAVAQAWNVACLQRRLGLFSARVELAALASLATAVAAGLLLRAAATLLA